MEAIAIRLEEQNEILDFALMLAVPAAVVFAILEIRLPMFASALVLLLLAGAKIFKQLFFPTFGPGTSTMALQTEWKRFLGTSFILFWFAGLILMAIVFALRASGVA